jgi:L-alanine-DL-glutamate epimerase-like enolase superfamily enzyme
MPYHAGGAIMKIKNIETFLIRLPCHPSGSQKDARGVRSLDVVLVRVDTDTGISGWGDVFCYGGLAAASRAAIEHLIKPKVMNQDASDIAGISHRLQSENHVWGRYGITMFAISAIDIALWDIAGKAAGLPLHRLFGGPTRLLLPAYASLLRYGDADAVAVAVSEARAAGYPAIKLHEITLEAAQAGRAAAGEGVPLMMDTNCPWLPVEARTMARRLAESGVDLHWLEEPIFPPEDFASLASVRAEGVPIAAGENACTAFQFQAMFEAGAVDYAQPSVTKVGGITELRKVQTLAETFGVTMVPHSPYFGTGLLATLHVLAAMPKETYFERYFVDLEASLFGDLTDVVDGYIRVPEGPGLGCDPNPDVMRDFRMKNI